jgi:hypothetical protein
MRQQYFVYPLRGLFDDSGSSNAPSSRLRAR